MSEDQTQKVIAKIQKMLKHANDNAAGSEHERDNAMRMALKLMAKYNLSMADMDVSNKEDRDQSEMEQFPDPYRRAIAGSIAELFFCKFFYRKVPGKQKYTFHFVGLESNSITAMEMAKFVIQSVSDESNRAQKAAGQGAGFGTSFRNAAAARISQRAWALRQEAEEESKRPKTAAEAKAEAQEDAELHIQAPKSTALTLTGVYESESLANESYIKNVMGLNIKTKGLTLGSKSMTASAQGRAFGDKVQLSTQITGANKPVKSAGSLK